MTGAGAPRTFRRAAGTCVVSAACALLFGAGAASLVATSGLTGGFILLSGLALLSLINAVGAWSDRYVLSQGGIEHQNALLGLFGARPRFVPWEDILQVREHRALRFGRLEPRVSALFLVPRSGRRIVLDSLADFEEARAAVRQYHAAARSGR